MTFWTWAIIAAVWGAWNVGGFIVAAKARFARDAIGPQVADALLYISYVGFIGAAGGDYLAKRAMEKGETPCKIIYKICKDYPKYGIILKD